MHLVFLAGFSSICFIVVGAIVIAHAFTVEYTVWKYTCISKLNDLATL